MGIKAQIVDIINTTVSAEECANLILDIEVEGVLSGNVRVYPVAAKRGKPATLRELAEGGSV